MGKQDGPAGGVGRVGNSLWDKPIALRIEANPEIFLENPVHFCVI